jgi:Domain of unknown function (DUF4815)
MALDLNISPFYDDFSEDKKFYKILFRPGYALQARELTQLQSIIHQQIKRQGDHIFKQGSMVIPGQISYDTDTFYVKLVNYEGIDTYLSNILNKEITTTTGLVAEVINYTLASGGDPDTIFVKYKNSLQDGFGENISEFQVNESMFAVEETISGAITVADIGMPTGKAATATIKKGVYYINNNFVLVDDQTIILDKYTASPSYKVGLQLEETVIYPEDDASILDNALGSPNYTAPGAARYYMDLALTKVGLTESEPENFIELLRLENGKVIFKIDRSQYAELEKTLARRTYDESGDYALSPFGVQPRNFRNNFRNSWAPSEKYIQGDVIRTKIDNSVDFYYFTATIAGQAGTSIPSFSAESDFVTDNQVRWEYTPLPIFNQGVYSFNSGDDTYAQFTLDDHVRLDGMLAYGVEAGKAYVRGYEIEKLATEYLPVNKSRDLPAGSEALADYLNVPDFGRNESNGLDPVLNTVSATKTVNIDTSMGSYVLVKNTEFAPDLVGLSQINLYDAAKASAGTNNIIGKARVRGIEFHNTLEATAVYKLFLFDIQMNSNKFLKDVKALGLIDGPAYSFVCNAFIPSGQTELVLNDPQKTSLVYNLPDYAIRTIASMDYTVTVPYVQQTSNSSGVITLNAPTGYTFESTGISSNYLVIGLNTATNAGGVVANATLAGGGGNLITISGLENQKLYTVFAALKRSNSTTAASTIQVTDATDSFITEVTARSSEIFLERAYGIRIVSVKMSTAGFGQSIIYDMDITNRYYFSNNSDMASIGRVSIKLQDGAPLPTGPIQVRYEYLAVTESSKGNVLAVNSYTAPDSGIRYGQIYSQNGFELRDSIDFRPRVTDANYSEKWFPKYGATTTIEYDHYLPRIDNIALTSTGVFITTIGVPSLTAIEQDIPTNSMKLARISLEPYTFDVDSNSVRIDRVENKRYTMRDIGKLERRIQDLEYYTSLSLLEMDTKNLRIVDSDGLDRFQNGFIVDTFDGQGVGNSSSPEWNASIDSNKKELRPFFNQRQVDLLENSNKANKQYRITGDLVTLPYTEVSLLDQPQASRRENVNPYALYSYIGILGLTPTSDTWFSTERRPDIVINDEGQFNAVVSMAEEQGVLGTVWNSWQTVFSSTKSLGERMNTLSRWSQANTRILNDANNGGTFWRNRATFTADELAAIGVDPALAGTGNLGGNVNFAAGLRVLTIETTATETTARRSGVRSFVVDQVDSRVLEDRVVDTKIVPFIRPRALLVRGFGFRANTRLYNFFDGTNVDRYVQCATRIRYNRISGRHDTFTTTKNCGSNVQNAERLVSYATGLYITGTVTVTNGSTNVVGFTTSFLTELSAGDTFFIGDDGYIVENVIDNTTLTLKNPYTGISATDVASTVLSRKHSNLEVELAFSHGEVIKEYNAAGVATGRTAIVVGQESNVTAAGTDHYVWVLNERGDMKYSTDPGFYFEGEYTDVGGTRPRIRFAERTTFDFLTSSATGQVNGIFRVPNNPIDKFRTGTREYHLTSSPSNGLADRNTYGTTYYQANGLVEVKQRTIISTRTAEIVSETVSDDKTVVNVADRVTADSGWFDPLAQTFLVQNDGGCFITSVDLFFGAKDPTGKIPVRIEIREVVNGYPGKVVLPFSRVSKQPSEIVLDTLTGSVPTNFKFSSPVYLQNGTEYALTVLSDSDAYEIWVSQTLETNVMTKKVISSQPYNGVLFKSQNASTWTADQTQDMKFKIYRANFSSTSADVEFIPPTNRAKNLGFNPFNFIENGTQFRVEHRDHGFKDLDTVTYTNRQITTFVNGIPAPYLFNRPLPVSNVETDMYMVDLSSILPRSGSSLEIAPGAKTFVLNANYSQVNFDAFRAGQTTIRFTRFDATNNVVYANAYMEGTITSISPTSIVMNITEVGSATGTFNSWILSSTGSGKTGGSYISATENYEFQTVMMTANTNVLPETAIDFTVKTLNREEAPVYNVVQLKENLDLFEEHVLPSEENYLRSNLPMLVNARLTTTNTSLSPVIDLHGVAMTLVNNKADDPNAGVNDPFLDIVLIANSIEIQSGGDGELIEGDGNTRTVTANSLNKLQLYTNLNRLRVGNVCRFVYTGVTGASYQVVTDKYFDDDGNIYIEFEPEIDPTTGILSGPLNETTSNNVDIAWMSHYVSEIAPFGGTVTSKYVTKKVNFSRSSDMAQVMFSAIIPNEAEVDVYYKAALNSAGNFDVLRYRKVQPYSGYNKNDSEFKDMVFRVENIPPFDTIVVKIVMRSKNKGKIPRIKDLRVISCAA